ncbi:glycosyltransferase [Arthrobacter agilis]|jgi:glycosyltransferase involved in cell wall biosynthesis|uniref:glycosyltransferase n=1 Tax=Arthrobacter agilis TaxID=37921 RepID=UPI00278B583A|nr:glycosyltransferase [Arthrobacter agilis]MDQ0737043.1 glycosyltransferase involved in cell wall biosynthesis [Arthrobacter agilis]
MHSELIVLSHLRWEWVWQRPQQLVSRLNRTPGRTTYFVEEPLTPPDVELTENRLGTTEIDGLTRVYLEIPEQGHHVGFFDEVMPDYIAQLPQLLGPPTGERVVWIYTPLVLEAALALEPTTLVYDVMDDLAAFRNAAPELLVRQRQALKRADVVFAGGRSLHRSVVKQGREDAHLVPSGVSVAHYAAAARAATPDRSKPVAGYVGVLDERLDLDLVAGLAERLPEWEIRMIGPICKIEESDLPQAPNITYYGQQDYKDLPALMAEFDVALMPFALNEATKSISPTKTLEYLASRLPVVSTRVPDVVADFPGVVELQDDAAGFAAACEALRGRAGEPPSPELRTLLRRHDWDRIAELMDKTVFDQERSAPERATAEATA